ncbi:MAG: hypothetical protein ABH863_03990 [Candidatus Micrarchaeota archaeon]
MVSVSDLRYHARNKMHDQMTQAFEGGKWLEASDVAKSLLRSNPPWKDEYGLLATGFETLHRLEASREQRAEITKDILQQHAAEIRQAVREHLEKSGGRFEGGGWS